MKISGWGTWNLNRTNFEAWTKVDEDEGPVGHLHPWSLTWNLKINPWKRRFLLETIIFRFHVKLWGVYLLTFEWLDGKMFFLETSLNRFDVNFGMVRDLFRSMSNLKFLWWEWRVAAFWCSVLLLVPDQVARWVPKWIYFTRKNCRGCISPWLGVHTCICTYIYTTSIDNPSFPTDDSAEGRRCERHQCCSLWIFSFRLCLQWTLLSSPVVGYVVGYETT